MKLHIQMLIYLWTKTNDLLHAQTWSVFIIQIINWVNDRDNWMKYFDILFGLELQGESWLGITPGCVTSYFRGWPALLGEGCWTVRGKISDILRRVCILNNNNTETEVWND